MSLAGDRAARLGALLEAELLVPTPDPPAIPGTCDVVEPEQLVLALHEDDDGLAVAAFTSAEAFLVWRPEGGACARRSGLAVVQLAAIGDDGRLVVDPGSAAPVVVSQPELAGLMAGAVSTSVPVGTPAPASVGMLVAASAEPLPPPMAGAIGDALAAEAVVVSAHLVVIDDGSGSPGRCIAVQFQDQADDDAVAEAMDRVISGLAATQPETAGLTFVRATPDLYAAIAASGTALVGPGAR